MSGLPLIGLPPTVRIYLSAGATDLRRSIDGLCNLVVEKLALAPQSGHLFVFRNRGGDRVKILVWDRSGFWLLYKRLEKGTFAWPKEKDGVVEVRSTDLTLLLCGVDPRRAKRRRWYDGDVYESSSPTLDG